MQNHQGPGHPTAAPDRPAAAFAAHRPPSPVFVDSSGRRQRLVRRLGRLLVIPAAGYVVLLVSTLLGGPTVHSPLLPAAQAPHPVPAPPAAPQSAGPTAEVSGTPAPPRTPAPAANGGGASVRATASRGGTSDASPVPSASATTSAEPSPSADPGGHGRSSSAPGKTGKPSTHP
ncbi:hypothetical protein OG871_30170 [Kitasatospora sp. NBC_00374]|uniref:hypothetical protein n=1 Tax=Kitasatospora sp. NBC_00374 TaxID=2975964 RepID=UPI00324EFEBB